MTVDAPVSSFDDTPRIQGRVLEFDSLESTLESAVQRIDRAIGAANTATAKADRERRVEQDEVKKKLEETEREVRRLTERYKSL